MRRRKPDGRKPGRPLDLTPAQWAQRTGSAWAVADVVRRTAERPAERPR